MDGSFRRAPFCQPAGRTAEQAGFGRALFSTRVVDVMEKRCKQEATSFFLGVLISLDLKVVEEMITPDTKRIVLYGKKLYPSLFGPLLQERYPLLEIDTISEEQSDALSAEGALEIYKRFIAMKKAMA